MDREKVIKEFTDFVKSFSKRDDTYYKGLFNSVLALLKEQKLIEPVKDGNGCLLCGNQGIGCGVVGLYDIETGKTTERYCNYCPDCGKRVKWE